MLSTSLCLCTMCFLLLWATKTAEGGKTIWWKYHNGEGKKKKKKHISWYLLLARALGVPPAAVCVLGLECPEGLTAAHSCLWQLLGEEWLAGSSTSRVNWTSELKNKQANKVSALEKVRLGRAKNLSGEVA